MSTKIIESCNESLTIKLDNGEYTTLKTITEKWHLKDIESLLKYAIAILDIVENGKLLQEKDGNFYRLYPADKSLGLERAQEHD